MLYLKDDIYKGPKPETLQAKEERLFGKRGGPYVGPTMHIRGLPPTKANIDEHMWKVAQKYKLEDIYPALLGTAKTESARTQWKRRGKDKGKILTSETDNQGIMQLGEETARNLGVEREDWRGNVDGGGKLWSINYKKALEAGMSRSDAIDYAAMSFFSGGAGGKDPSQNTSAVEVHNQRALTKYREKNPNAALWEVPHRLLRGAPSQVSKYGGPKVWRANMSAALARKGDSGKGSFSSALDRYAKGVKRRSEADKHYVREGTSRSHAEKLGLQGYRGPSRSMPISQTQARPEDLRPPVPKPKAVASSSLYLKSPVAAPARQQAETKRVAGLDRATAELRGPTSLPAPSKVLSTQPRAAATQPRAAATQPPAVATSPVRVKKSLFQSEYFIEV